MIVKKVIQLCKKAKTLIIFEGSHEEQYISDGKAIYPLDGMPHFDEASISVAFDMDPSKVDIKHEAAVPTSHDVGDTAEGEAEIEESLMTVGEYIPYMTSVGVTFIDKAHLAPVAGDGNIRIFERHRNNGTVYFAVKRGFLLAALIEPTELLDEKFVANVERLARACRGTFECQA